MFLLVVVNILENIVFYFWYSKLKQKNITLCLVKMLHHHCWGKKLLVVKRCHLFRCCLIMLSCYLLLLDAPVTNLNCFKKAQRRAYKIFKATVCSILFIIIFLHHLLFKVQKNKLEYNKKSTLVIHLLLTAQNRHIMFVCLKDMIFSKTFINLFL